MLGVPNHEPQEVPVNDKILPYLKMYAALIGSTCTALLGIFTADTTVGKVLTVLAVIATALVTFQVPNLDVTGEHADESVQDAEDIAVDPADNLYDGHGA